MIIVFNIAAIFQALLGLLIFTVLYGILWPFGNTAENFFFGNGSEFTLIILYGFMTSVMDLSGLKGRLFWLPTWIVCIIATLFLNNSRFIMGQPSVWVNIFAFSIALFYILMYTRKVKREWGIAKMALKQITESFSVIDDEVFWRMAAASFYSPHWMFKNLYFLWAPLFGRIVSDSDVMTHYRSLLNCKQFEEITSEDYRAWMIELREKFDSYGSIQEFHDIDKELRKVARVLRHQLTIYGGEPQPTKANAALLGEDEVI